MIDLDVKSVRDDFLAECYNDTRLWAKGIFPERFEKPFTSLHDQVFELIDSGAPRIAIAAPRGMGKTSMVGLALSSKKIIYSDSRFLSYVSNSATNAELQTENLKRELIASKELRQLGFPPIKTSRDGIDETFSKKAWVANSAQGSTMVLPRGSGQQVRGLLYINARPDMIVIDDLEDTDTIENPEIRLKRKLWFHADLLKSVSRFDKNWQIIYIDTLKHEDSLLQDLLESSDWESLRLEICDDNLVPVAPEFMSQEEVLKEYNYHKSMGLLDVFYREFRNIAVSLEDAVFQQEYFRYYEESDLTDKFIETVIIVDPAKTVKLHSADSAIIAVGIDRESSRLYVRDLIAKKLYPDQLYNEIFLMAARFGAKVVGVEVTSLNEFIVQPIKNEMIRRGHFFELVELKARGKKEERIAQLSPFYRQGFIFHNPTCCLPLENQLLTFPRSKRLDAMDALAYIIEMMELGERYFEPPNSEDEDEFIDIEYEEPISGWRAV